MGKNKINGNKFIIYGCIALGVLAGIGSVVGSYFGIDEPNTPIVAAKEASKEEAQKQAAQPANDAKVEEKANEEKAVQTQPVEHHYSVLIKKSAFTLYLMDNGKLVKSYGVAIAKNPGQKEKRGDMKTPTGTFRVDEILDASAWTHDFGDGKGEIKGAYGPWFISLDTMDLSKGQWDGIGIHGTHDPASIGTRASEGCIRLLNENVDELKQYVQVGTMVTIEE